MLDFTNIYMHIWTNTMVQDKMQLFAENEASQFFTHTYPLNILNWNDKKLNAFQWQQVLEVERCMLFRFPISIYCEKAGSFQKKLILHILGLSKMSFLYLESSWNVRKTATLRFNAYKKEKVKEERLKKSSTRDLRKAEKMGS